MRRGAVMTSADPTRRGKDVGVNQPIAGIGHIECRCWWLFYAGLNQENKGDKERIGCFHDLFDMVLKGANVLPYIGHQISLPIDRSESDFP